MLDMLKDAGKTAYKGAQYDRLKKGNEPEVDKLKSEHLPTVKGTDANAADKAIGDMLKNVWGTFKNGLTIDRDPNEDHAGSVVGDNLGSGNGNIRISYTGLSQYCKGDKPGNTALHEVIHNTIFPESLKKYADLSVDYNRAHYKKTEKVVLQYRVGDKAGYFQKGFKNGFKNEKGQNPVMFNYDGLVKDKNKRFRSEKFGENGSTNQQKDMWNTADAWTMFSKGLNKLEEK